MRAAVAAVLSVCLCLPAQAGRFTQVIAATAAATRPDGPTPTPQPSSKCENCDGVGTVGDGTIKNTCPVCKGTGKKPAAAANPDTQSTPWHAVGIMLNALAPKPNEVLLDPGCGNASLLIEACKYFGTEKAIGIEIDPEIAELARQNVEAAGFSDQIEIITGDSTKLNVKADIGIAYMWPEVLADLKPKIEKLDRFVCFGFAVPGLDMQPTTLVSSGGKFYSWKKPAPITRVPVTKSVSKIVGLPRGSYCTVCGRHCSNPMAHVREQQIVGYVNRTLPATSGNNAQPQGHWETRRVCNGGTCRNVRVFVSN
jgi:hypothetical protein